MERVERVIKDYNFKGQLKRCMVSIFQMVCGLY